VTVNLVQQEQAVFLSDLTGLKWDMVETVNTSKTGDADQILGRLYISSAKRLGYSNANVDSLAAQAAATTDQDARAKAYAAIDKQLWDDAAGIWPMEVASVYAVANRVVGFTADSTGQPTFVDVKLLAN